MISNAVGQSFFEYMYTLLEPNYFDDRNIVACLNFNFRQLFCRPLQMSLLQDADWLIRQLRIEFIRTEDPVAERMISFAIPSAHYLTQTQKTPHRHHDSPSLEANANQPNIPPRAYSQPLEAADSAPKLSSDRISSLTALSGNQLSDSESLHSMQAVTLPHATQNGAPQTPPSVSVSQMNLAMEDEVDRPGIITYLIDPVPEQSLCYSPNITQFVLHSTNQDLKGRHSRPVHQVPASATTSAVTTNQQIAALAERKTGAAAAAVPPALPLPPARPSTAPAPSAVAGNRVPQLPQPLPPRRPVNLPQPPPIPNRPQFLNSTASSEALVMTSQQSIFTKSTQNLTATSSMSSTLSKKIKGSAAVAETNPFAKDFGFMGGRGEPHPIKLKFYFPFSTEPKKPVVIQIRRDATVEQAIGYSLFVYFQEKREPPIVDTKLWHCAAWNMRICEDDGVVDEDFPGN